MTASLRLVLLVHSDVSLPWGGLPLAVLSQSWQERRKKIVGFIQRWDIATPVRYKGSRAREFKISTGIFL